MAGVNAWDDENFPVAMFVEEPYDPTKIPMYCKDKVYDNGVEYSLEEIRARRYGVPKIILGSSGPLVKVEEGIKFPKVESNPLSEKNMNISRENVEKKSFQMESGNADGQIDFPLMKEIYKSPQIKLPITPAAVLEKEKTPTFKIFEDVGIPKEEPNSGQLKISTIVRTSPNILEVKENDPLAIILPTVTTVKTPISVRDTDKENLRLTLRCQKEQCLEDELNLESAGNSEFDTTSYTKAFNLPVLSSTPMVTGKNPVKRHEKESESDILEIEKTFAIQPTVKELSMIEESSKEMISGSSATNLGSGASSAESDPSGTNISRIPSVMVGESVAFKRPISSRIPAPLIRVPNKDISVKTSQQLLPGQKLKEFDEDQLCRQLDELIITDDPFDNNTISHHLKNIAHPISERKGSFTVARRIPIIKVNSDVMLRQDLGDGGHLLKSLKNIGQGAYAKVYKAFSSKYRKAVAVKIQKPACEWEFYINMEIHERIKDYQMRSCFMSIEEACFFIDGSILIYDFMELGTLLDIINLYKSRRTKLPEVLALIFTMDVLKILDCLHTCNVIHGDIKPDNFLLRRIPSDKPNAFENSLQLIDLGRCIDMTLYPEGACFTTVFQKTHFQCIEMRSKKPWTYQLDLFGAASIIHCLIFGDFMEVHCKNNIWNVNKKVSRNMNQALWNSIFDKLLNIGSTKNLPNLNEMIKGIEKYISSSLVNELRPSVASLKSMLNEERSKRK